MYARFFKRCLDIVIGIIAMPILGVLVLVLGPKIKHEDGGPVFYNAPRVGKDGKPFTMYTERTIRA